MQKNGQADKTFILSKSANKLRQKLKRGDSATLWEAVIIAKGNPSNGVPEIIVTQAGQMFSEEERPQAFADCFQQKVNNILTTYSRQP
jgi:hypothetical protein